MLKLNLQIKNSLTISLLCFVILLSFGHTAWSVVRYPSVASLGVGDIKSSHIKDGEIVNADVNAAAAITSKKLDYSGEVATSTNVFGLVMDYLASISTSSETMIISDGSGWVGMNTTTLRWLMNLGDVAMQTSTDISITGGSITGITDITLADGGTGQSWGTMYDGGVPYFNTSSSMDVLHPGSAGEYLQTQGTSSPPVWKSLSSSAPFISIEGWAYDTCDVGTWTFLSPGTTYGLTGMWFDSGASTNDECDYMIDIPAGTYTLVFYARKGGDSGIVEISIDGGNISHFDLYNGSETYGNRFASTTISIPTGGIKELLVKIDGKNGSASAYDVGWNNLYLFRTSATP